MLKAMLVVVALLAVMHGAALRSSAQSDAYMRLMRSQNQRMMNRARIYSAVRSGARATRYDGASRKRVARRGARRGAARPNARGVRAGY